MTRCIIHVGMHKTGSTSIQDSLNGFADATHMYADLGGVSNHSLAIYSLFAAQPEKHHLHVSNRRSPEVMSAYLAAAKANLEQAIQKAQNRTLIISGEDICVLPQGALEGMRKFFRRSFDELEIVAYVRPPAGFIASSFQQRVKGSPDPQFNLENNYRNYEQSFGKFDAVFGRDNVHLWKFDPGAFPQGCVVRDFCRRLGIPLPAERIVRRNESLSRQAVALLYVYRKLGRRSGGRIMRGQESHRLGNMLAAVGNDKFRFSPELVRPVLEMNRGDIAWMERRLGASLHEDIGEARPGDVRGESDLLSPDPALVKGLLDQLGDMAPKGVSGRTPEEVAVLVHAMREKCNAEFERESGGERARAGAHRKPASRETGEENRKTDRKNSAIRVRDLIAQVRQEAPRVLDGIPDNKAVALIRRVYGRMNDVLARTDGGMVNCPGFGKFRKKPVKMTVEGKKVERTLIIFQPAEQKDAEAAAPAAKTAASRKKGS